MRRFGSRLCFNLHVQKHLTWWTPLHPATLSHWSGGISTARPRSCSDNSHITRIIVPKFNTEKYFHVPSFLSNTVTCPRRLTSKYHKNVVISFFHRKSIMLLQDTLKWNIKIAINDSLNNMKA